MFALTDDIIHEVYHDTAGEVSLWEAMQQAARRSGRDGVARAVHLLRRFVEDATRMPLVNLIRNIIQTTNYDLVLLSVRGGKQRSRNLWKLVSVARDHEDLSCHDFAQKLTLMREFEIKQSDAPLEGGDAVKLMTIHASKGLEFPLVALPALSGNVRKPGGKLIYHRNYGFALNTTRTEQDDVPVWYSYASRVEMDMEVAERKRLLYVSMTRARDYLGIFLDQEANKRESFRLWLMEILRVDGELLASEDRVHERRIDGAPYVLSMLEQDKLARPYRMEPDETGDGELVSERERSQIKYDLIDRIESDPLQASSPWSGWTRVTPDPVVETQELDATIVGTYFHAILEHLPADGGKLDPAILRNLAVNQGSAVAHPEKLKVLIGQGSKLLEQFYESSLYPMMRTAKKRFSELPYLMVGEFGIKSKRPDLLLQDKDGKWYIIDYKTDSVPLEELDRHARLHYKQLQVYVNDLRILTGQEFTPLLYFARHAKLVDVRAAISSAGPATQRNALSAIEPDTAEASSFE
jgi:ATP-dependent exoDNAse (exonuclease V) beta subunit (contains helicase and exonuclease domains)